MILSKNTINVLNNYATINQGILFNVGSVIRTKDIQGAVLSQITVPEVFPVQFGIYDLSELISALSLVSTPEIVFSDTHLVITDGRTSLTYYYSSPKVIVYPQGESPIFGEDDSDITFVLKEFDLTKIEKASKTLKLRDLRISSNSIKLCNNKAPGTNQYSFNIESTGNNKKVDVMLNMGNLKLMNGDYEVKVNDDLGVVQFKLLSVDLPCYYWISLESE